MKLHFSLNPSRTSGLSFLTHRGSTVALYPGAAEVITFINEEKTETELLEYYNSRYLRLGLRTKVLADAPTLNGTKITEIEVKSEISEPVSSEEKVSAESPVEEDDNLGIAETCATCEISEPVSTWKFDKMREFVEEHNIDVDGRSKADYITAIEAFIKKGNE